MIDYINLTSRSIRYDVWRTYWCPVGHEWRQKPIGEHEYLCTGETAAHCLQRVQEKYAETFEGDLWLWVSWGQYKPAPEKIT